MLSGLRKREQKSSAPELSENTAVQSESDGKSWKETSDDVVTVGTNKRMSHQERYEFVKNRTYYPLEPSQTKG